MAPCPVDQGSEGTRSAQEELLRCRSPSGSGSRRSVGGRVNHKAALPRVKRAAAQCGDVVGCEPEQSQLVVAHQAVTASPEAQHVCEPEPNGAARAGGLREENPPLGLQPLERRLSARFPRPRSGAPRRSRAAPEPRRASTSPHAFVCHDTANVVGRHRQVLCQEVCHARGRQPLVCPYPLGMRGWRRTAHRRQRRRSERRRRVSGSA